MAVVLVVAPTDAVKRDEAQNGMQNLICSLPRGGLLFHLGYGCENCWLQCFYVHAMKNYNFYADIINKLIVQ